MKPLFLYPGETSQWHALLNEAQVHTQLILDDNMHSYLLFLLMRFMKQSNMMESVLALDFLEAVQETGQYQVQLLQELGDKSLLFSGLFPEMAARRQLQLTYFSEIGQAAYLGASAHKSNSMSDMFLLLSEKFIHLQQILQAVRQPA